MRTQLRVLAERDFRLLFASQALSVIGDRLVVVTLALFITQSTGSPTDLGIVLAAQSIPFVTLLLIGGVWADRLPRHRIMLAADLARGALHALLAVLIVAGAVRIWQIAAIEFMFGAAQAFFQPAYSGLLPQTVPDEMVQEARALTELVTNLAFVIGPALATVLVLGVGAGTALALDAASFFVSAALLARIHPRARGEGEADRRAQARPSLRSDIVGGWREVRSRSWVWVSIAVFTVTVLFVYAPWTALAPSVARTVYGHVGVFGWLETALGAGAVAGGLVTLRLRPARPLFVGMVLALAWPLQNLVLASAAPLPLTLAASVAGGLGFSMLIIWWETALVHHIPPDALSRVSAYDWMGSLALNPLGYLLAGPLAAALGARWVLGVGGLVGVAMMLLALLPRSTRELGGAPTVAEVAQASSSVARSV